MSRAAHDVGGLNHWHYIDVAIVGIFIIVNLLKGICVAVRLIVGVGRGREAVDDADSSILKAGESAAGYRFLIVEEGSGVLCLALVIYNIVVLSFILL